MKKYRYGISLVLLVIMVVVIIALLSIGIISFTNSYKISGISAFSNDLKDIEDLAGAYIIENGENSLEKIDKTELKAMVNDEKWSLLTEEMVANLDATENETEGEEPEITQDFYIIDLEKIGVKKSVRGYSLNGVDDVYVLSANSGHAYYLKGLKVSETAYFSISPNTTVALQSTLGNNEDLNKYWLLKEGKQVTEWTDNFTNWSHSGSTVQGTNYLQMNCPSNFHLMINSELIDLTKYKYCYVQLDKEGWVLDRVFFSVDNPNVVNRSAAAGSFKTAELIDKDDEGRVTYRLDLTTLNLTTYSTGYLAISSWAGNNHGLKIYNAYLEKL